MLKYELILFDMDGTILNTLEDLKDSLNHALDLSGFPQRSLDEVRRFVGNGIRLLIERGVPEGTSVEAADKVHADFTAHYTLHSADKTRPYAGVIPLIEKLRGMGAKTAVVSNKADAAVQPLCERYFPGLFDIAVGERPGAARKPAPDCVNAVLRELGVERDRAVYIGDSEVDIETAQNAGLDCITVDWGFRERDFLRQRGAEVIASTPEQVLELLVK